MGGRQEDVAAVVTERVEEVVDRGRLVLMVDEAKALWFTAITAKSLATPCTDAPFCKENMSGVPA